MMSKDPKQAWTEAHLHRYHGNRSDIQPVKTGVGRGCVFQRNQSEQSRPEAVFSS